MFNLFRINKKIQINHISFTKKNYIPANIKPFSYKNKIHPLNNNTLNTIFLKTEKPNMVTFFYMILGITVGSFIYYIKL
jgi:hypothetical protein